MNMCESVCVTKNTDEDRHSVRVCVDVIAGWDPAVMLGGQPPACGGAAAWQKDAVMMWFVETPAARSPSCHPWFQKGLTNKLL